MMQTTRPINDNIILIIVQPHSTTDRTRRVQLAIIVQPIEEGAILPHIESLQLCQEFMHVVRCGVSKKMDVVVRVKFSHLFLCNHTRSVNVELVVKTIRYDQGVCHADPVRLHWV